MKRFKMVILGISVIAIAFILSGCLKAPSASGQSMIYVVNNGDNTVSVINGQTNSVVQTVSVGTGPIAIGVDPTTDMIYVANWDDNTVSVINGQTNSVVQTVSVGNLPQAVGVFY